jgi:hypothetical protein
MRRKATHDWWGRTAPKVYTATGRFSKHDPVVQNIPVNLLSHPIKFHGMIAYPWDGNIPSLDIGVDIGDKDDKGNEET